MVEITPMTVLGLHQLAMEASNDQPQALPDAAALESALARTHFLRAYGSYDSVDLTVAVVFAMVQNDAFVAGNKRTAWQVLVWLLYVSGYTFNQPSPAECASVMRGLAAHEVSEFEFSTWLRRFVSS